MKDFDVGAIFLNGQKIYHIPGMNDFFFPHELQNRISESGLLLATKRHIILPSITWRLILFPSLKNFPQNSQGNLTPWYVLTCLLKVCLSGNPVFSQPGHNNSTIPCSTSKCSQKALSPCRSSGQDLHFQNWVSNHFWVLGIDRAFWKCLHKWTTCSKFRLF